MLRKVSKSFYDKVYRHEWLKKYFENINQEVIESQQVDFIAQAMGGPDRYCGKFVPEAHSHMMISEELFVLREELLNESLVECGACLELRDRWNKIDRSFKRIIVKNSLDECKPRFHTDTIINFENPHNCKKAV